MLIRKFEQRTLRKETCKAVSNYRQRTQKKNARHGAAYQPGYMIHQSANISRATLSSHDLAQASGHTHCVAPGNDVHRTMCGSTGVGVHPPNDVQIASHEIAVAVEPRSVH